MARRTQGQGRFSNRQKTWSWVIITVAIVVGLLYREQIALLYVLATVSVTVLLLVVAASDLHGSQGTVAVVTSGDKPLVIEGAANEAKAATQSTFGSRSRKRRR